VFVKRDDTVSLPAIDPSPLRRALSRLVTFRYVFAALGWDNPWLDFNVSHRFTTFTFWSQVPQPEVILRARDETLSTLDRMNALARARGAVLGVVAIPFRDQVYAERAAGAHFDTGFPQAYVKVHCAERGIPFLDLLPPLRQRAIETRDPLYLREDIHFNDSGHALAGSLMREWFLASLAPRDMDTAR
jgi:SGNH hydrolase-like domain, acetyltransferase AlgX